MNRCETFCCTSCGGSGPNEELCIVIFSSFMRYRTPFLNCSEGCGKVVFYCVSLLGAHLLLRFLGEGRFFVCRGCGGRFFFARAFVCYSRFSLLSANAAALAYNVYNRSPLRCFTRFVVHSQRQTERPHIATNRDEKHCPQDTQGQTEERSQTDFCCLYRSVGF